jgi:hypothetical protein
MVFVALILNLIYEYSSWGSNSHKKLKLCVSIRVRTDCL